MRYNEEIHVKHLLEYLEATQAKHYAKGERQTMEHIIDAGYGKHFAMGNIIKYASRFGKKDGENPLDLYKLIHYALIVLEILKKEAVDNSQDKPTT